MFNKLKEWKNDQEYNSLEIELCLDANNEGLSNDRDIRLVVADQSKEEDADYLIYANRVNFHLHYGKNVIVVTTDGDLLKLVSERGGKWVKCYEFKFRCLNEVIALSENNHQVIL